MARKNYFVSIFVLLALFAVITSGGCGGSGSGSGSTAEDSGTLIGEPHGEMGQYLQEKLSSLGGVVLLSAPDGLKENHEALPLLRESFDQGQAIALLQADKGEVNILLKALGVDVNFPGTSDDKEVNLFAVRKASSGNRFFVTLNSSEGGVVEEETTKIEGVVSGDKDNPDSVIVRANVGINDRFYLWALKYGDGVEILDPARVRKGFCENLVKISKMYSV